MPRRVVSVGSILLALIALAVVLLNATLVDRRGPAVTAAGLSAPVEGQEGVAQTLTAIDIQFSEPVRTTTVERRFRIEPRVDGSITWDGSTAIFTPSERLPQDTEFRVSVEPGFEDLAGNVAQSGLEAFTFRTIGPPAVVETAPTDGAEGVTVDSTVTITFDRVMDTDAVERALSIEPAAAMQPTWSGRTLTLAFDSPLLFGMTYTVTIQTAASDTDGSPLRAPFRIAFTTVKAGLAIVETLPADGVAGINVRTPIAIVFDHPIDPGSIDDALTITPSVDGGVRVVALPDDTLARAPDDPEPPRTVLLFEPANPLAPSTTYTVELDPVVTREGDSAQVATDWTWTFTTGSPTSSAHNHIAWLTDRSGVHDVWIMNPDGSAPRQLTSGLASVSAFDLAPDGARVAYASGGVVRTTAVDGSSTAVVTAEGRFEYAPRFSPDGRRLLLARREPDGTDAGWWIVPLDGAGGPERQVLPVGAPPLGSSARPGDGLEPDARFPVWATRAAWDPTGRWAAVPAPDGTVAVIDLDAADPATSVATAVTAGGPLVWSPDLSRFLVVGREPGRAADGLYAIGTDGTVERRVEAEGSVAISIEGAVAYLLRATDGVTHVASGSLGGSSPARELTSDGQLADRWPAFSPDGATIVFGRVEADDPRASRGIWTVESRGGPPVALTTDGAYPRWVP